MIKSLHNGRALMIGLDQVDAKILDLYPALEVIGCNCTGLDHIDLDEINKRGIKLISLKSETEFLRAVTSTAEHTLGLIIALMRNYKTALNEPYKERETYIGNKLSGKILGIIGSNGRIGKQLYRYAHALDMKIIGYDKDLPNWWLTMLLKEADIVSLNINLDNNEGFFTKEMFQMMKKTAYFINTSRSQIVEKGALLWALKNNIIAGAAVDFVDDHELLKYNKEYNNLILTPHIGGATHEDMALTEEFILKKCEKYLNENKL